MAKTSKERIEERRIRIDEYKMIRQVLLDVISASDAVNADRIEAIKALYRLDVDGIPYTSHW